ncbi:hypothetical protein BU17DRAFT_71009 [Hysterangium stoloniferum]|nr:hypothetical protein BU17DRAFT_71009 [Hysterangium stoloniferum]
MPPPPYAIHPRLKPKIDGIMSDDLDPMLNHNFLKIQGKIEIPEVKVPLSCCLIVDKLVTLNILVLTQYDRDERSKTPICHGKATFSAFESRASSFVDWIGIRGSIRIEAKSANKVDTIPNAITGPANPHPLAEQKGKYAPELSTPASGPPILAKDPKATPKSINLCDIRNKGNVINTMARVDPIHMLFRYKKFIVNAMAVEVNAARDVQSISLALFAGGEVTRGGEGKVGSMSLSQMVEKERGSAIVILHCRGY